MKVLTWNVRRAGERSPVWDLILEKYADIVLLQEVGKIPDKITNIYEVKSRIAVGKNGSPQKFSTAILVKGKIISDITLVSEHDWVNNELLYFSGNFIGCVVSTSEHQRPLNVISVYSPAWPVDKDRISDIDVSDVKLKFNPNVWGTEIIWSALKNIVKSDEEWIVGGDYNISETFDVGWQNENKKRYSIRSHGSREIIERMYNLGFVECLRGRSNKITPTFRHTSKLFVHQLDHLYVSSNLYRNIQSCFTTDQEEIFGRSLSDHLPIVATFK